MNVKKTLLATALAALAFAALPALAAANPSLDIDKSGHFTIEEKTVTTLQTAEKTVTCQEVTGTGTFEGNPSTGGTVQFTFHGCKSSGLSCGTEKSSTGRIETPTLPFDLVTATDETHEPVDAVLITPEAGTADDETVGHYATFKCAFNLIHVDVRGSGVIGVIESPATNDKSSTFAIDFANNGVGTQQYEHICVEGETSEHTYDLESKIGNGEYETAAQIGTAEGHFTEGSENTLT